MKNIKFATLSVAVCGVSLLALATATLAATDGTLGATSTGTADVSLTIDEVVRITDMDDFSFGAYSGAGNLEADDSICVYHNGDGQYKTTITDDSVSSPAAFAVEGPLGDIPMEIKWNDKSNTVGNESVTFGTALQNEDANTQSETCATGGLSANIKVELAEADIQSASAGAYTSTLTVLVEPD